MCERYSVHTSGLTETLTSQYSSVQQGRRGRRGEEGGREREKLTLKTLDLEGETILRGLPRDTVWGSCKNCFK